MNQEFVKALNERGILNVNSKILANYKGHTLDGSSIPSRGELLVKQIDLSELKVIATPLFGQTRYVIAIKDIIEIDGMDPIRLGRVFNINPDGSPRSIGKKRGRKPKNYSEI